MWNYSKVHGNESAAKEGSQIVKNISCSETIVIINCAINAPLMLISIIGNSLVLAAILRTPSLRSPSITFLCSLAVSDLLVGCFVQPLYIASGLTRIDLLDILWYMVSFATCGISLCSITAISVDRYLAVHYHMRYPALMTKSRAILTLVIMWLFIFLLSGIYYLNQQAFFLVVAVGVCVCLLISIFAYIGIFRIVRHQQQQIHTQQQAVQATTENFSNLKQLKKSALNSFVFFIVMVLFYFPMSIALFHFIITKDWEQAWSFATTAVFMNSSVNPLLYCWRLGKLRTAVVKIAKKILCKQS